MFEIYFDDGATDSSCPLAIASCYLSTKRGWSQFDSEWDCVLRDEGFDYFHMTDFAARPERGVKPYCNWDAEKRRRVYRRLANVINCNKWAGFGLAVPKDVFDREVPLLPEPLRSKCGKHHFTFAFKGLLSMIESYREKYDIKAPMQYVFDQMGKGRGEIKEVWDCFDDFDAFGRFGMERYGCGFKDKRCFKPLQAADILAWQLHDHMRNVIGPGKDDVEDCHPHFRLLRANQNMKLAFMTETNFKDTMTRQLDDLRALTAQEI